MSIRWASTPGIRITSYNVCYTKLLRQFEEAAYVTWLGYNPDPEARECRYGYTSLTHPASTWALDLHTGEQRQLRQQAVLGNFAPEHYRSERCWIPAEDGVSIPVSLVYRNNFV